MGLRSFFFGDKRQKAQIKGFTLWGFGITFEYTQADFKVISDLINFFEDRSELFSKCDVLRPRQVFDSIVEIRTRLGQVLTELSPESKIKPIIQAMQKRCRDFTTAVEPNIDTIDIKSPSQKAIFDLYIGGLREVFWIYIAILSEAFHIRVRNELKQDLPDLK